MQALSHALTIVSAAIPVVAGTSALEPVRLSGLEGINNLFAYELLLKTPDALNFGSIGAADFNLDNFIGREISCIIELDGAGVLVAGSIGASTDHIGAGSRQINALITDAALWGEEGRHVQYKLTLRPWLHLATLSTDCKIFQNKTVVEILDELLSDYGFPVDKRLFETYPARDFQTQWNESDFAFFERLCQEWGISYHFAHADGKHRLVLSDAMGSYQPNDSAAYRALDYHAPGWKVDSEYISSFVPASHLTSGQYSTTDYDYARPKANLSASRKDPRPTGQANGEVFQWHAAAPGSAGSQYAQPGAGAAQSNDALGEGRLLALLRMQALRTHGDRAEASGNLRGMVPGCTFRLQNHPRQAANVEYLILQTRFVIEDVAQDSQSKDAIRDRQQRWQVQVDFTAHPVTQTLRPAATRAKPLTGGPQPALVVGPEGENLWTDSLGRIKVHFPWDRIGQKNQHATCWLRVSSPWAGNQLGGVHLPRIGQEVVVDFYGGDPDLPICTGRVHNQMNLPPWALPDQSALSGFRSRELTKDGGNSAAGRSNHLVMDDTATKIQIQLKSDHQHSSLSMGHITRVEDNAGRKDARGEGFELRTDGWGAVRSEKGLLLSTDGRTQAVGGMLSRDELVRCLEQALFIAKDLDKVAARCEGGKRDTDPQEKLSQAIDALGHGASNEGDAKGKAGGGQPVMGLSGAAGLALGTPQDLTQYAGVNIDTVAGNNQQHYADKSILHAAGKDIEQFAHKGDIRNIASEGKVIVQAQHNSAEITSQKRLHLSSTEEDVVVNAKKSITLALEDGTYMRMEAGNVTFGMTSVFTVHSADAVFVGPATLPVSFPKFFKAERENQVEQLLLHRQDGQSSTTPKRKFHAAKGSGEILKDESGGDATAKLKKDVTLNVKR
ncbi:MAG: type VI secretion system tip protein VgrG [Burkholderiaceae bacterium]|nr:type VI secretion system tip protein VgrG [Burkholderiaceae bacterium]